MSDISCALARTEVLLVILRQVQNQNPALLVLVFLALLETGKQLLLKAGYCKQP